MPTSINTSRMAAMQDSRYLQPATQWTEDPNNHILRVCLPGFRKDDFKVQVDDHGKLKIRGRRPLGDDKYQRLEKDFDVPRDSHIDNIRGKFVDACLCLFIPKKVVTEKEPQTQKEEHPVQETIQEKKPRSILVSDDKLEEYKKNVMAWKVKIEQEVEVWLDYGLKDGLLETISKNKKTIAAAAAAFAAGFYISQNLRSSGR